MKFPRKPREPVDINLAPLIDVVELTLALHKVFDSPKDKIVWDVGHQSYVHKIITGRKDNFKSLRQHYGGFVAIPKEFRLGT